MAMSKASIRTPVMITIRIEQSMTLSASGGPSVLSIFLMLSQTLSALRIALSAALTSHILGVSRHREGGVTGP
jgi:hypothetical protein